MIRLRSFGAALVLALVTPASASAWQPMQTCGSAPTHWDPLPVHYRIHQTGSQDLPITTVEASFAAAWETWASPCCSAWSVVYDGRTTTTALDDSPQHVISFVENNWPTWLGSATSTIATTQVVYSGSCVLLDADIVFNGVTHIFVDRAPNASNEVDLQSIATHEGGHWLGLGHSSFTSATMYAVYDNDIGQRTLHADDEAGVCALYPRSCSTTETSCVNEADDDGDGAIDCSDSDCAADPACSGPREQLCTNGLDDDGDETIDCADGDCAANAACSCTIRSTLSCNTTISGDTRAGTASFDSYTCSGATSETGTEQIYELLPTSDGRIVIDLAPGTGFGDIDLVLLDGTCRETDCAAASSASGSTAERIVADVRAGVAYYIVVDTFSGRGRSYGLTLACPSTTELTCGDARDDDLDGATDCADSDCSGQSCGGTRVCINRACACPTGRTSESACTDTTDDDCDGAIDCADPDCTNVSCGISGRRCGGGVCACPGGVSETACADSADNDCDGLVDCADANCAGASCGANGVRCSANACVCPGGATETTCTDGADGDRDGLVDCADLDCGGASCGSNGRTCAARVCACPGGSTESSCTGGVDEDCDDLVDCADPDCDSMSCGANGLLCVGRACGCSSTAERCDNFADDDCDGQIDCLDDGCNGATCGASGERCSAGACLCAGPANETSCTDGADEDCDALADCADSDCAGATCGANGERCASGACTCPGPASEIACGDAADEDCDGRVDCADPDCEGLVCEEGGLVCAAGACGCANLSEDCENGVDDDCDALADCEDNECAIVCTDAGMALDAGMNRDGAIPTFDSGSRPDGSIPLDAGAERIDGGCGCRALGRPSSPSAPWWLLTLGALFMLRIVSMRRRS